MFQQHGKLTDRLTGCSLSHGGGGGGGGCHELCPPPFLLAASEVIGGAGGGWNTTMGRGGGAGNRLVLAHSHTYNSHWSGGGGITVVWYSKTVIMHIRLSWIKYILYNCLS